MLNSDTDIQKFAEKLVRAGREAIEWEKRKLQWILEQKKSAVDTGKAD